MNTTPTGWQVHRGRVRRYVSLSPDLAALANDAAEREGLDTAAWLSMVVARAARKGGAS